jgi:hypothetical protein
MERATDDIRFADYSSDMKILGSMLVSLAVAAGTFLVSAPFLVIESWAGFAVLGVLAVALFSLRERLGLGNRLNAARVGVLITLVLLVPARFYAELLVSGFDDGPFTGRPFAGDLSKLRPSERVPFRAGEIVIYNRARGAAPVVEYRARGRTEWAQEMFVSLGDRGENELREITDPRVSYGVVRDRLDFIGTWTYGAERGYAFIWKWGGIQRFYLSW